MQYILIIFSIALYFIMRKQNTKIAIFFRKYRSLIIILFGILILFLFNSNHFEISNITIPVLFIFTGIYYFFSDYKGR